MCGSPSVAFTSAGIWDSSTWVQLTASRYSDKKLFCCFQVWRFDVRCKACVTCGDDLEVENLEFTHDSSYAPDSQAKLAPSVETSMTNRSDPFHFLDMVL